MSALGRLLDLDGELARLVPEPERDRARRALTVPVLEREAGPLVLDEDELPEGTCALLVVSGTLIDAARLAGRELSELVLPGEVLLPWRPVPAGLPSDRVLCAVGRVQLAVLERQFLRACALWPQLIEVVHRRLNDQEHRVATRGLICQLPRVEQRVMAVLWHLADRIGTVGVEGVAVPIELTHAQLGRLIGAQRPTVSLAVKQLTDSGALRRQAGSGWLLAPETWSEFAPRPEALVAG